MEQVTWFFWNKYPILKIVMKSERNNWYCILKHVTHICLSTNFSYLIHTASWEEIAFIRFLMLQL